MPPPHNIATSRRTFLKTIGAATIVAPFVTRDLLAAPPSQRLRHASFGASNMAWQDLQQIAACDNVDIVAICDVDLSLMAQAREAFPNARFYQDWRELLEKEHRNIDSVNVSVPDHMHAAMAVSAMQLGKHVYCQKPLAHNLHEVRRMTDIARATKVVTQMGIQIHTSPYYRMAVKIIQDGVIGKIREVHSWYCNKNKVWGDADERPDRADPVPSALAWDLWVGVREARSYIGDNYYHPQTWRKRLDFGTGTLGDMACHIFDPVYKSLGLSSPIAVRSEGPRPNNYNWAPSAKAIYTFNGTPFTAGKTMNLTWYDGAILPPDEVLALMEGRARPNGGSLFIGTSGAMLLPHIEVPVLYPSEQFKDYQKPRVPGANLWKQFVETCRGNDKASTDFNYAGPLTEAVLLGGVASRFPRTTLRWNTRGLKFDLAAANQYIRHDYREGWKVEGL